MVPNDTSHSSALCWDCARACGDGNCEWADRLSPVPGCYLDDFSGRVLYCPKFIPGHCAQDLTDEQYDNEHTNDFLIIGFSQTFCRPRKLTGEYSLYSCPMCGAKFGASVCHCPNCDVSLLWQYYSVHQDYKKLRRIQAGKEK